MPKRILVPLDQTVESEAVLPLVADIARGGGATVRLLHVAEVPDNVVNDEGLVVAYADQEMTRQEMEGADYLRSVEARLEGSAVESVVRFGDPVEEIAREAETFVADLIVFITSHRRGLGRLVLGGTAERVIRKIMTPILVLRPDAQPSE